MVMMNSIEQWFRHEGETSWHVNSSSDPTSLCGQTRMRSNIDNTADALPFGATACAPCDAIRDGAAVPEVTTAKPVRISRARQTKKK
jgi:hypothetical protein